MARALRQWIRCRARIWISCSGMPLVAEIWRKDAVGRQARTKWESEAEMGVASLASSRRIEAGSERKRSVKCFARSVSPSASSLPKELAVVSGL